MAHGEGPVRLTPDVCEAAAARIERVLFEVKKVIVGQEAMLERAMVALVARGHALLEGVPGLAKTLTVKTLAQALDLQFKRIQFTPDLVPADLLGTRVYNPKTGEFSTELGPVFANLVLADEINRAPAKVQSALLEVMQEHQVTIGGRTYPVPEPFLVMATQNPIESEGTYALPEAQVDRFMFKVLLDYPSPAEEAAIVSRMTAATRLAVEPVLDARGLRELQDLADLVYVDPQVVDYTTALIRATRHPEAVGLKDLSRYVLYGASPRTTVHLVQAAKALAFLRGRDYVVPTDVRQLAPDVLRHRLVLSYEAMAEGWTAEQILQRLLSVVPLPKGDLVRHAS